MRLRLAFSSFTSVLLAVAACGRTNLDEETVALGGGGGDGQGGASVSSTSSDPGGGGGLSFCGDGDIDPDEQCDDGNFSDYDSCTGSCRLAECGDTIVWEGTEQCDDGNPFNDDGCISCALALCGDGFLWAGVEQCDDGNFNDGDGCKNNCSFKTCGDGVIEPGEQCDDGNLSNSDACLASCFAAKCGDSFLWAGVEQCDDGNASSTDACVAGCIAAKCGDGFVRAGVEQCDDGNASSTDACLAVCVAAKCGDGFLWAGVEQCDDGNQNQGDGCHNNCKTGVCGDAIADPGEQCDDGNGSSTDACVAGCVAAKCGDGFVRAGVEQCDDGNVMNGDGCSSSCKLPGCGDGSVDPGEACDLGGANANRPAFLLLQGALSKPVEPVDRVVSAVTFYAYSSASSHTGYEAPKASRIFLYRDVTTGILSLFLHHGVDTSSSGQQQPQGSATFNIVNLPAGATVALSDDTPSEFLKSSPTSAQGAWKFQNNSDGGVLSGLPVPGSWSINISPGFTGAIDNWSYVDGDDSLQGLALAQTATLKAFDSPSACRLDCTVPACGDGILDGGEVCDDGNTVGGDGCSANCKALQ